MPRDRNIGTGHTHETIFSHLRDLTKSCKVVPVMPAVKKETKESKKAPVKASKPVKDTKIVKAVKAKSPVENGGFAVVEAGGKQYRVSVGDAIKIEIIKGDHKVGDQITFDKVLLVDNGKDVTDIGTPYVEGAKVTGTLAEIGRDPKVTVIKYKQKSRYFKKNGHRQPFFKVEINKIA